LASGAGCGAKKQRRRIALCGRLRYRNVEYSEPGMITSNWTSANILRVFCAVLFLSLGVGHRSVQAATPLDSYGEEYRLPDGSFADICAAGHDEQQHGAIPACEVCRLASSIVLPTPAGGVDLPLEAAFLDNPLRVASLNLGFTALARATSRGPPFAA
jgi:hypothetical protein